jgi:Holliday junction resolvase RusA-like endonuclease
VSSFTFTIPGPPVPKGRPRHNTKTGAWYTPKRTKDYEARVAEEAMAAGVKLEAGKQYTIEITYYLSTYRGDCTNLNKSIEDGLNGFAKFDGWDDRQIVGQLIRQVGVRDASEEKAVVVIGEKL